MENRFFSPIVDIRGRNRVSKLTTKQVALEHSPPLSQRVRKIISDIGSDLSHPLQRVFFPRLMIQLHRFSWPLCNSDTVIKNEALRISNQLRDQSPAIPDRLSPSPTEYLGTNHSFGGTELLHAKESEAKLIHQTCHYLQSVRPDGLHLGLYTNDETLLALATLSPFDLDHIDPHLPHEIKDKNILVLSRFITFDWSPQNTASYTLGQVARWLRRERPGISAIFTYLDPNAGFDGSIYKAVNAQLLGYEHKKRYLYLDRDYVTDREMIRRFGTAKIDKVRTFVGDRIESSSVPLESLRMYLIPVSHVTDNSESWDIKVDPPESLVG